MPRFRFMQWTKWTSLLLLGLYCHTSEAQVTGGTAAMEFLRLSNAPHISALGSINVSHPGNDISFALQNPSLMRPGLHNQLGLNYNAYYAGISIANMQYGYHAEQIQTSFALAIQYLNYGSLTHTDQLGNELNTFTANDYAITAVASRQYKERWRYGASLKWAQSSLYNIGASALLMDVGINYIDTGSLITIGAVAKNMGFMVKKYNPANSAEPLPFDLQIGISKRFKHIPLRLMATIHHLYEWNIRYDNPEDVQGNNLLGTADSNAANKSHFTDKLFRHLIFAAELTLAKRLTVTAGYNHLRRAELGIQERSGMSGFSFGFGLNLNRLQVHYARSYYHVAGAYNEIGFNLTLNKMFGIGKFGKKINWDKTYDDYWQ